MNAITHYCYRPHTKLREGNVFTPVFHSVHRRSLCQGGLCPRGSLSGGLCLGVSVQWSLYPGGLCPWEGLCPGGSLSRRGSLSGRHSCVVKSGWYASYWNAFLYFVYLFLYLTTVSVKFFNQLTEHVKPHICI